MPSRLFVKRSAGLSGLRVSTCSVPLSCCVGRVFAVLVFLFEPVLLLFHLSFLSLSFFMGKKSSKSKMRRRGMNNEVALRSRIVHPPALSVNLLIRQKIRFQAGAASTGFNNVNVANICGLTAFSTTSTQLFTVFSAVRVREIEMWGPTTSSLAPVTVAVRYPAGVFSGISNPEVTHADVSIGSTVPAYVRSKPPKAAIASNWVSADLNSTLFQVLYVLNTIVDLTFEGQLSLSTGGPSVAPFIYSVVGATVGDIYTLALDLLPSTGPLVPVARATVS